METVTMKKKWVSTDAWRGYYTITPPKGWYKLTECNEVNDAGHELAGIFKKWAKKQGIHVRTGYVRTSNVFSSNFYIVIDKKLPDGLKNEIDKWFVDSSADTFSIFSGESHDLNKAEAERDFSKIVSRSNYKN